MMLSTAGEVNASRTGGMEQSERGDEPRGERWSLDELKRVERLEKVRQSNFLKLKTRVGKFQFGKNNANTTGFAQTIKMLILLKLCRVSRHCSEKFERLPDTSIVSFFDFGQPWDVLITMF